jgi:hypothetical protein
MLGGAGLALSRGSIDGVRPGEAGWRSGEGMGEGSGVGERDEFRIESPASREAEEAEAAERRSGGGSEDRSRASPSCVPAIVGK